jgi:hypothetical protein
MSLPVGSLVLTLMSCDMCECVWYGSTWSGYMPSNVVQCQSHWAVAILWLYADGHVHHWCCSKDPSTMQLLIDTTTVLQYMLSPCASLSTKTWKCMGQEVWLHAYLTQALGGGDIRKRETLDRRLCGPERQSWSYTDKKILSTLPGIKPPFLDQPAIHFASTLNELDS